MLKFQLHYSSKNQNSYKFHQWVLKISKYGAATAKVSSQACKKRCMFEEVWETFGQSLEQGYGHVRPNPFQTCPITNRAERKAELENLDKFSY